MPKDYLDLSEIHDGLQGAIHPRVRHTSQQLFCDGHFKQAALEALISIEKAIQEKTGDRAFGRRLVQKTIGGKVLQVSTPVNTMRQKDAREYFEGVFGFYRNFLAHTNEPLSATISFRALVIASDLLDLVQASRLSVIEMGGAKGLVKAGFFESVAELQTLLAFVDNYYIIDEVWDGFWEELALKGFDWDSQLVFLLDDCDMLEIHSELGEPDAQVPPDMCPELVEVIKLTPLGRQVLEGKV